MRESITSTNARAICLRHKCMPMEWACIMLYEELMRLEETGDYELIKIADDVQADSVTERKG